MFDRREVLARSDGTTLYLKVDPTRPEMTYAWTGPTTAHHATIEESAHVLIYMTKYERKVSIYDEASTLLGELTDTYSD